jgi:hypothetical protein
VIRSNRLIGLDRANIFFVATAICNATGVIGPIICASLMQKSIWYPIWLGLALQLFSVVGAFALPETLARSSHADQVLLPVTPSQHDPSPNVSTPSPKTRNKIYAELAASVNNLVIIFGDWKMGVMAGLYPVRMMCMALFDLLPRYISYRYHWSFASATYLLSLQALGATFCLLLLLPIVSENLGKRFELGAVQKNVVLARLSLGILSVSLLLEGLAPNILTLICGLLFGTLGAGAPSALRALAGSLTDPNVTGKVFAGLAVAETLSMMAAYPTVAGLYNVGIGKGGGAWLGMPFDIAGLFLGASTVVMCILEFGTAPGS